LGTNVEFKGEHPNGQGGAGAAPSAIAEITVFKKRAGPLSKRIHLVAGKIGNDSSQCAMSAGAARRVPIDLTDIAALAQLINGLGPREAYAIGRLKEGLPDHVRVVVADKLAEAKDDPNVIARTKDHLVFIAGAPAICLHDVDAKAMPEDAKARIRERGVWAALCAVVSPLANTARVVRPSTSHGLRNKETGETYPGSGGFHAATAVGDGGDIPRYLADFHDRLWLAGWGWGMVSGAGSFLERSLVDKAVASPERLIFEAPPVIVPPLEQAPRLAEAVEGDILDTMAACPPLTDAERTEVERLKQAEKLRLKSELDEARAKWSESHLKRLVASGMTKDEARAQVDRWLDHKELSGDFPLPFDDPKLAGASVADVLARPDKYVGQTLSDPFEGPSYGRGKAIVYRRDDASLFVNSFAHGGCVYALAAAPTADEEAELDRLARMATLDYDRARVAAAKKLGCRPAILDRLVAAKRAELSLDGGTDGLPGRPITFDEIDPWPEPVDGAELLTDLSATISAYVVMSKHQSDAAALWATHAHAHDLRDTSPPLVIKSPAMRSGKTKLVEVLERLVPRPLFVSGITVSFLERAIEAHRPTLLIDEYDALTSGDPALAERRGARVGKSVPLPGGGYESRLFSTWAPTVIAGIGEPPSTVRDRAVVIDLKRKLSSEKVRPLRERDGGDLTILRGKIARFVGDNEVRLRNANPAALAVDNDRAKDMWEPLIAIADVAGGDWPQRARDAGLALAEVSEAETAETDVKLLLLADIRDIFEKEPKEPEPDMLDPDAERGGRPDDGPRISSKRLLEKLVELEERPWSAWGRAKKPITGKSLGDLLRPYGVRSRTVRIDGETKDTGAKGYYLRAFDDAFARYLPTPGVSKRPNVTNPGKQGKSEDFANVSNPVWDGLENAENASKSGVCNAWTDEKGGVRGSASNSSPPQPDARLLSADEAYAAARELAAGFDLAPEGDLFTLLAVPASRPQRARRAVERHRRRHAEHDHEGRERGAAGLRLHPRGGRADDPARGAQDRQNLRACQSQPGRPEQLQRDPGLADPRSGGRAVKEEGLPMTDTTMMTSPLREAARQGAQAMSRFPGDGDDNKERRALQAAFHVAGLKGEFSSVTAVRFHLERLFGVSERQIRRVEKILRYPDVVQLVLKGPVSVTNAAHVIEHAGFDMLCVAWACASEDARREFREQLDRAGLLGVDRQELRHE
jgi:hypothetical protein